MNTHAIIVAAGKGERSGLGLPKQFATVRGKPMLEHSIDAFSDHPEISQIWLVIGKGQSGYLDTAFVGRTDVHIVEGGKSRRESVSNGLAAIAAASGVDRVLIHDAARPYLPAEVIDRLLTALQHSPGAIPVMPVVDTLIAADGNHLADALDRERIRRVQTPQAFHFEDIWRAHQSLPRDELFTDDSQMLSAIDRKVALVDGDERLAKFTFAEDFAAVDQTESVRTGMGYDVHRLVAGEELWLGGILVPHDKGLSGHSDADVLLHAITDALLGAIAAGDIGDHFPPSDPQWRDAASDRFLQHACALVGEKGGTISNIDATVVCEAPKIKPYREKIRNRIAEITGLPAETVSLKATTTEGLGFTGRGEGIAAQAVATVKMAD